MSIVHCLSEHHISRNLLTRTNGNISKVYGGRRGNNELDDRVNSSQRHQLQDWSGKVLPLQTSGFYALLAFDVFVDFALLIIGTWKETLLVCLG